MIKNKNYNGVCDLYRFLFAIMIMFHHARYLGGGDKNAILSGCGYIAVEFFFILSGYFAASSVSRMGPYNKSSNIGKETAVFVLKKVKVILFYYLLALIPAFITSVCIDKRTVWNYLLSLYDAALLSMTGIKAYTIVHATWYLSAMFIVLLIIYPLLRKNRERFTMIIAPIMMMAFYGLLSQKFGNLDHYSNHFYMFFCTGLFRAFADISLGTVIFEICERLKNVNFSLFTRILFSIVNIGLLVSIFFMVDVLEPGNTDFIILAAIAVLMTLTLSKCGVISRFGIFYSPVFKALGTASLVIYLNHFTVKEILAYTLAKGQGMGYWEIIPIYILLVAVVTLVMMLIKFLLEKLFKVIKEPLRTIFIKRKEI